MKSARQKYLNNIKFSKLLGDTDIMYGLRAGGGGRGVRSLSFFPLLSQSFSYTSYTGTGFPKI